MKNGLGYFLRKHERRIQRIVFYVSILFFAILAYINSLSASDKALILFILFACTSRISHVILHWIIFPINLICNKAGSEQWVHFSLGSTPIFRAILSSALIFWMLPAHLVISLSVFVFLETIARLIVSSEKLIPRLASKLFNRLFPSYLHKINAYAYFNMASVIALGFVLILTCSDLDISSGSLLVGTLIGFYFLSQFLNWFFTMRSYFQGRQHFLSAKSAIIPAFLNINVPLVLFLLFVRYENDILNSFLMPLLALVLVTEYLVESMVFSRQTQKSRLLELTERVKFNFDVWLYFILILISFYTFSLQSSIVIIAFTLLTDEISVMSSWRKMSEEKFKEIDCFFIGNFQYFFYDDRVYRRLYHKLLASNYTFSITYRWNYFHKNRVIQLPELIENAKSVVIDLSCIRNLPFGCQPYVLQFPDFYDWDLYKLKNVLLMAVSRPYRILTVTLGNAWIDPVYLNPLDGRFIERTLGPHYKSVEISIKRESKELEFLFTCLDESILNNRAYIEDEVSEDALTLNDSIRADAEGKGFILDNIYANGLTPLLILHRRTHEFSMVAGRFMELLNLFEVAARWIMILERPRIVNLSEEVQFSFGGVVSEIRATPFAEQVLFENADELAEYKKVLQSIFGYSQKENVRFRVIDFMNWVVFIRNKTRGHGSPSRVSMELYKLLELNTLRLLRSIAEYYDPEVLMCSADFYVVQRGMKFDFKYYDEQPLPDGISREVQKPFIRHAKSNSWYTSDELMTNKDNIYLLSAVKKGKCEWVCYNTGELIRPDVIVL